MLHQKLSILKECYFNLMTVFKSVKNNLSFWLIQFITFSKSFRNKRKSDFFLTALKQALAVLET